MNVKNAALTVGQGLVGSVAVVATCATITPRAITLVVDLVIKLSAHGIDKMQAAKTFKEK
jgi:hypothetical protein